MRALAIAIGTGVAGAYALGWAYQWLLVSIMAGVR